MMHYLETKGNAKLKAWRTSWDFEGSHEHSWQGLLTVETWIASIESTNHPYSPRNQAEHPVLGVWTKSESEHPTASSAGPRLSSDNPVDGFQLDSIGELTGLRLVSSTKSGPVWAKLEHLEAITGSLGCVVRPERFVSDIWCPKQEKNQESHFENGILRGQNLAHTRDSRRPRRDSEPKREELQHLVLRWFKNMRSKKVARRRDQEILRCCHPLWEGLWSNHGTCDDEE